MEVLYFADRDWPCDHAFIEEVVADHLVSYGHSVTIYFFGNCKKSGSRCFLRQARVIILSRALVRIHGYLSAIWTMRRLGKTHSRRVVVVRNDPVLGVLAILFSPVPVVFQLSHQREEGRILLFYRFPSWQTGVKALSGVVGRWLRRWVMKRAVLVLPISKTMADALRASGERKSTMVTIPLSGGGLRLQIEGDVSEIKQALGIKKDQKVLLYVGTLNRLRQLDRLIEAFRLVRENGENAVMLFVGEGPSPVDRRFLEECACEIGVEDKVVFFGNLARSEVSKFLLIADVGLSYFPDLRFFDQNSPIKVMEYLAAGTPVAASPQPEQSELITLTRGGKVACDCSPEAMCDAMLAVLRENWDRGRVRTAFLSHRDHSIVAERLEKALTEVNALTTFCDRKTSEKSSSP